jgi:hypothetical protein
VVGANYGLVVIDWLNSYKYLGINMAGIQKEITVNDAFKRGLLLLSSAPLKPQQKLFTLKQAQKWLHLPNDTTDAFIHSQRTM